MSTPHQPDADEARRAADEQSAPPDHTAMFSAYYDDELSPEERESFEAWLEADDANREDYEAFAESLDALHTLGPTSAPPDFVREVTQDIRRRTRGNFFNETWLFGYRIPYEVFAAVVLALFGAIYLFGGAADRHAGYSVSDPPESAADASDEEARETASEQGGRAAGVASRVVDVTLPAATDLSVAAQMLRADGFSARPDITDGEEAVLVSVPRGQRDRFAERVFVASGVDIHDRLDSVDTSAPAVTVRLTVADER